MITREELEKGLKEYFGTIDYHVWDETITYTDGVKYLTEAAYCTWLLDVISRLVRGLKEYSVDTSFLKVKLLVFNGYGRVTVSSEASGVETSFDIKSTKFPLEELNLYYIDGILLLTGEY